jgi:hypothetical protein
VNPVDVLRYGQRDIEACIGRLRPDDWTAVALGVWTTKDLVGHLGVFEVRFGDVLASFLGESPSELMRSPTSTFNDVQAAIRADWSVDQVLGEYRDASDRVARLADQIPVLAWEEVGTIPWYGREYALDDLAIYTVYSHKREHKPQFEAVLDRPGR